MDSKILWYTRILDRAFSLFSMFGFNMRQRKMSMCSRSIKMLFRCRMLIVVDFEHMLTTVCDSRQDGGWTKYVGGEEEELHNEMNPEAANAQERQLKSPPPPMFKHMTGLISMLFIFSTGN